MTRPYHREVPASGTSLIGRGIYTLTDAARLTGLPRTAVVTWSRLLTPEERVPRRSGEPSILTFDDLITLLVVTELRRDKVPLDLIHAAQRRLAKRWRVAKPFASKRVKIHSGYRAIFTELERGERPVSIGEADQETFWQLIREELRDVTYNAHQRADEWRPRKVVSIRPDIQFGAPCLAGTRVTTETLYNFALAGEDLGELAEDYGVDEATIKAVVDWEGELRAAA